MKGSTLYCLGLLVEEFGEVLQWIGKAMRFGIDTPGPDGTTARDGITRELGDVDAGMRMAGRYGVVEREAVMRWGARKMEKFNDPAQRDNLGRPLVPPYEGDDS